MSSCNFIIKKLFLNFNTFPKFGLSVLIKSQPGANFASIKNCTQSGNPRPMITFKIVLYLLFHDIFMKDYNFDSNKKSKCAIITQSKHSNHLRQNNSHDLIINNGESIG